MFSDEAFSAHLVNINQSVKRCNITLRYINTIVLGLSFRDQQR